MKSGSGSHFFFVSLLSHEMVRFYGENMFNSYKTREAKRVNSDREWETKLPIIKRNSKILFRINGHVWNMEESARCEERRNIDETRRFYLHISVEFQFRNNKR